VSGFRLAAAAALAAIAMAIAGPGWALGAPLPPRGQEALELEARTLYAAGEYQKAVQIYARLYAETLHPTYLRNIGRCQQNLGDADKAIASFREYLRKARSLAPASRAEIEGYIAELEGRSRARLAEQPPVDPAPPPPPAAATIVSTPAVTQAPSAVAPRRGLQPGVFVRADLGVRRAERGVVLLPGLSLGLGPSFELSAAAFLGHHKGGLAAARLLLGSGAWRPGASLGLLLLAPARADGGGRELRPGLQLGPGLRWDVGQHLALAADVTGSWFPGADGAFGSLWLVPSLSVQGRL